MKMGAETTQEFLAVSCMELIGSGISGAVFTHVPQHYINAAGLGSSTQGLCIGLE